MVSHKSYTCLGNNIDKFLSGMSTEIMGHIIFTVNR